MNFQVDLFSNYDSSREGNNISTIVGVLFDSMCVRMREIS